VLDVGTEQYCEPWLLEQRGVEYRFTWDESAGKEKLEVYSIGISFNVHTWLLEARYEPIL
jgi:hypothetical protein